MEYIDIAPAPGHPILRACQSPDGGQQLVARCCGIDSLIPEWIERTCDSTDPSSPWGERPALRRVIRFL